MAEKASTLLLFGATGDLSRRMLLPSLYGLDSDGLLPPELRIIGTARTDLDDAGFRDRARAALQEHLPAGFYQEGIAERFLNRLHYVPLDIKDAAGFERLAKSIGDPCHGVAIFLSTAPSLFKPTIDGLEAAGLACPTVRMALEKPLGTDLESSREINDAVASAFPEDRTFRIDHYLGKETVQNLLALRFANLLFEPLWNAAHIDHVQITVAETVGLEGRAEFYESAGALRDMVQNHMLQLLALVAMEPPSDFNAAAVRDEKVKVLRALRPITAADVEASTVTGQYVRGAINGEPVPGYTDELGHDSKTETFVALKAHNDNWSRGATTRPNKLIIGLQPDETIELRVMAKAPGLDRQGLRLREVPLDLGLTNAFSEYRRRIAYERLLLDLIEGDPTLFVRRDEVEAQWTWIDRIRAAWADKSVTPRPYQSGTWGPSAAIALTERDGISWHE